MGEAVIRRGTARRLGIRRPDRPGPVEWPPSMAQAMDAWVAGVEELRRRLAARSGVVAP